VAAVVRQQRPDLLLLQEATELIAILTTIKKNAEASSNRSSQSAANPG
jgi:hypothetical protein